MLAPNLPEPGIVLGLVEAWPDSRATSGKVGATASLDQPCARRLGEDTGRDEGKAIRSNKGNA